eukprot:TRINITY_DN32363_c0_g1_i1.p1 TRINITY_DN32363_c0_g1~~TRINITY_DN32363_c0_g1_i1.p1  ORF type:complete len:363 (-),score=70.88 TRINITY_DN32363_c0_g1_i1:56-1144(-)
MAESKTLESLNGAAGVASSNGRKKRAEDNAETQEPAAKKAKKSLHETILRKPLDLGDCIQIPVVDPWGADKNRLLDALAMYGVVIIKDESESKPFKPAPYDRWEKLWNEAMHQKAGFRSRSCVADKHLRFSHGEDLARTLQDSSKEHTPDVRYNFGVGFGSLHARHAASWGELRWIADEFREKLDAAAALLREEVALLAASEPDGTLGALMAAGKETWAGSRLRHAVYPPEGSCTEHTDYGLITLQQSDAAGLEVKIHDEWRAVPPIPGATVVFVGDMLEQMTNGVMKAALHRVIVGPKLQPESARSLALRQSHIVFLQPNRETIVKPLECFKTGKNDRQPVRYGDWHHRKTQLAFHKGAFR